MTEVTVVVSRASGGVWRKHSVVSFFGGYIRKSKDEHSSLPILPTSRLEIKIYLRGPSTPTMRTR